MRPDLVSLSQTTYARTLRRDLNSLDGYIDFSIQPSRMPIRRSRGRIFRALAAAEAWFWEGGGDRLARIAVPLAIGALALDVVLHHHI